MLAFPYASGWGGSTGVLEVRLIPWGENQKTSNNVPFNSDCGRPALSYE